LAAGRAVITGAIVVVKVEEPKIAG